VTIVRLFEHPLRHEAPLEFHVESIGEWICQRYGTNLGGVNWQVYRGAPSADTEITRDVPALLANDAEVYTVLQSPGLEAVGFALYFIEAYGSLALTAYSVASSLLSSGGRGMPANVNRTSRSPNNALGTRGNELRLRQRIEDIYGTVPSTPSVLMTTYGKYINHRFYEFGYYAIGRGYYEFAAEDVIDGETAVQDLPGASAAVYRPFTSPNSGDTPQLLIGDAIMDGIVTTRRSIEVDGITLPAQNQVQLAASGVYTFQADAGGDRIIQAAKDPNFSAVCAPGDEITITVAPIVTTVSAGGGLTLQIVASTRRLITSGATWASLGLQVGESVVLAGFANAANNTTRVVAGFVDDQTIEFTTGAALTNETATTGATATWTRSYAGTREIDSVGDGDIQLVGATWPLTTEDVTASIQLADRDHKPAWVTIPTPDRTQVWVNLRALGGMFREKGGKSETSVGYTIEVEKLHPTTLVPTGVVETLTGTMSGKTSDERAITIEHVTAWVGPCRVRPYRSTQYDYSFDGGIVDEIKWADLYGVSPETKEHFGALTSIHTVTPATTRATASRTRQLRVKRAARLLARWSGTAWSGTFDADGRHVSGTIHATSRIVDILHAVIVDPVIGNRNEDELDIAQVWAVQQQLDALHADAGTFNYTLDDFVSLEETLAIVADAAFCRCIRQNGKIRLALDRRQDASSGLLCHRNKQPRSEVLTRTFAHTAEWDGVAFTYHDSISDQPETIELPLDGSARRLQTFELPGIRSFAQAWLRANREYRKLKGQRRRIETGALGDARLFLPNQRIDIVDNTRYRSFDGEVIAQSGLTLRLSQRVEFTAGEAHSIVLMRRDGSVQSIVCTAGADAEHVVLQSLPTEAIVTEHGPDGVRTMFSFAADSAREAQAYLITEIDPPQRNSVTVRAINYSASYYQADDEPIPDRASVIN